MLFDQIEVEQASAAAAADSKAARYATRPLAQVLAGVTHQAGLLGAPFVLAGALRSISDLGLYAAFRNVEVAGERQHVVHAADREQDL
jgi:hypothetical protein